MEGSFVNVLVVRKMRLRFDLFRARDRHERRPGQANIGAYFDISLAHVSEACIVAS